MPTNSLKICDIVQFYSALSGGVRRYIHEKIRYIHEHTPHEHCLVIPSHRNATIRKERQTIYEVKSPKLIGSASYRVLLSKRRILQAADEYRPDLIEVGDPYRAAWIGRTIAKYNRIPIAAFYHSDYPRALDRTLRKYLGKTIEGCISPAIHKYLISLYTRMDATIVSSPRYAETLNQLGINNTHTIALGTNLDVFYPRPSRERILKELDLPSNTRLLLFVGRLAREKNIRSLFEMMHELRNDTVPHHLLLVGDGEWREEVRFKAKEEDNISWLNFCESPERLADLYSAADVFVHAGTCETFGLVSLEAQACGTRVLAVQGGGLEESLRAEPHNIMARDASGKALAQALRQIWELDEGARERLQRRQNIEDQFSWNSTFRQITQLYENLCQRGGIYSPIKARKNEDSGSALYTQ